MPSNKNMNPEAIVETIEEKNKLLYYVASIIAYHRESLETYDNICISLHGDTTSPPYRRIFVGIPGARGSEMYINGLRLVEWSDSTIKRFPSKEEFEALLLEKYFSLSDKIKEDYKKHRSIIYRIKEITDGLCD